ncbi:anthranilate synthase component 1 [Kangiella sp. HD9-110m-PIT-SAG07]|nr:anthranilate synthase component 1 [Kangiella sp. HD9-110m-PIT-SAG07]
MHVKTLARKLPLSLSPFQVYGVLAEKGQLKHTALLETAEAGTHEHQRSVVMVSAALQVKALNNCVTLTALNLNGEELLKAITDSETINEQFMVRRESTNVELSLAKSEAVNDESQRLSQATTVSVLQYLRDLLKTDSSSDNESSLLVGAFSYELVEQYEELPEVNKSQEDYCFYVADQLVIQHKESQSAKVVVKGFGENAENTVRLGVELESIYDVLVSQTSSQLLSFDDSPAASTFDLSVSDNDYYQFVDKAKERILKGDIFQVVLARTFNVSCSNAYKAYGKLRLTNPSPYMYFINFGDKELFGASPESALKVNKQREVYLYPIAGTRKRAIDDTTGEINHDQDSRIEFELVEDQKESAEHMMLVDLARNDLAKVVVPGSREVIQLKRIVKYSHVQHMVSEVKGILKPEIDSLIAYRACANMGTLTGAPKIKAMEIIREQENHGRGYYGGAVCVLNANDEFDSAIIIRSAVVIDGMAKITAGAGIVYDSEPHLEALETVNKAKAVIDACRNSTPEYSSPSELLS